jgi:hypothetical protein
LHWLPPEAAVNAESTARQTYWDAMRRSVCATCLDAAPDASCGLPHGCVCMLEVQVLRVVEAVASVCSDRIDAIESAVESAVCRSCGVRESDGGCTLRRHDECPLYTHLPQVVDAIDAVRTHAGCTYAGRGVMP